MKKLFLLLIVLFTAAMAKADDAAIKCLLPDGTTHYFMLEEEPLVKFDGETLTITCKDLEINVNLNDGSTVRFMFINTQTFIREAKETLQPVIRITNECLNASNLDAGSIISIYNIKGVLISQVNVSNDGTVKIPLKDKGVFIVKTSVSTIKIKK